MVFKHYALPGYLRTQGPQYILDQFIGFQDNFRIHLPQILRP